MKEVLELLSVFLVIVGSVAGVVAMGIVCLVKCVFDDEIQEDEYL